MSTALFGSARQEYGNFGSSTSHLFGEGEETPCYIHGIAYAHGMKYRLTDTLDPKIKDPQRDPNYLWDPAVRLTHDQLDEDLTGKPMLIEHKWKYGPVGRIIHSWRDEKNRLNIIAETDQKKELGKWITRQVRAGLFQDLSIGYDTRVEEGTRKVVHKGIEEVSFVTGGYFPGCEVKVRASKNRTYKDSEEDFELEHLERDRLHIVKVMATNATQETQQQQAPPATSSAGGAQPTDLTQAGGALQNFSMDDQVKIVQALAKLKKENEELKRKEEAWSADKQAWEQQEKKRREDYAKSKEKEYHETMAMIEELTKADGAELAEADKTAFNALAFNPESAGVWNPVVKVTASNMSLRAELEKMKKENEELKKNHELTRNLLQLDDPERDSRRTQKLANREAQQSSMGGLMEVDPQSQGQVPAWIHSLLGVTDTSLRVHGVAPPPQQQQQAPPAQQQAPPAQQQSQAPPMMQTGGVVVPPVEQPLQQKVPATAGVQYGRASQPQAFRGSNPAIRYPVNPDSMRNQNTHSDVWGYIHSLGNVPLDGVGAHLAGRNFGETH